MGYEADLKTHYRAIRKKLYPDPPRVTAAPPEPAPVPAQQPTLPPPAPPRPEDHLAAGSRLDLDRLRRRAVAISAELQRARDDPKPPLAIPLRAILREVALFYGVSSFDILSQRRARDIVRPRQVFMYLAKRLTLKSLPVIGRFLSGRDHTTVLHGVRKITALVADDREFADEITFLTMRLRDDHEAIMREEGVDGTQERHDWEDRQGQERRRPEGRA